MVVKVPEGWTETSLPSPDLSGAVGVTLSAWNAWAPMDAKGDALGYASSALVCACFQGDPGTWTTEAEPIALEHLRGMVSSTALRVARLGELGVVATTREGELTTQRLAGRGEAEHRLSAETFLGFAVGKAKGPDLVGCFALCTGDTAKCDASVEGASVSAVFVPAPPTSLSLRAILAAVHHPSTTLAMATAVALLVAAALVVTRRRPRTK